jgi:hypothetical protein
MFGIKKVHFMVKKVRLETKKRFRPSGASWNQEGAFYGQEANSRWQSACRYGLIAIRSSLKNCKPSKCSRTANFINTL